MSGVRVPHRPLSQIAYLRSHPQTRENSWILRGSLALVDRHFASFRTPSAPPCAPPLNLPQHELEAWERCKQVGEDFTRLSQADQLTLTRMIERQLTQGSAHFREQSEAWLAEILGEEAAALMVDRPRG